MISQSEVIEVFTYDKGELYWNINYGTRAVKGNVAGNISHNGYRVVQFKNKQYYIHRLIYLYHYGYIPRFIDHKHGLSVGNYIWNLRPCSHKENMSNRKLNKNNKSGFRCVMLDKRTNKWYGKVTFKGKVYLTKTQKDPESAYKIIEVKRKELHGKFYNKIN